jgi:hypothetical protein
MGLTSRVNLALDATLTGTAGLSAPQSPVNTRYDRSFANGAGAAQANEMYAATLTIGASATTTIDVATGGGLLNALGLPLALARIKGIYVKAAAANANNVVLTRPAANGVPIFSAVSAAFAIKPDGLFSIWDPSAAGIVVTAATADLIDFTNSGAGSSVTCDVVIIGALT